MKTLLKKQSICKMLKVFYYCYTEEDKAFL